MLMAASVGVGRLTENAKTVLEHRYLWRNEEGRVEETPAELFSRVAVAVAKPEGRQARRWADSFERLLCSLRFLPNSPTLMNAGKPEGQLSACYVLPVGDSLQEIFEALKDAAIIHQSGGGTGFGFSRVRSKGSIVRSTRGVASGPVSFLQIFDRATETIKQGGVRRGANMGVLRVDHPDIAEFIDVKRGGQAVLNFNLSVGVTARFMECVLGDEAFALREPLSGREVRRVPARALFRQIAEAAWECGDPGIVFLDRMNFFNPTPTVGEFESTNPCGEQPLLGLESCNLGSLNLAAYLDSGEFDWERYRADIWTAVRFLDNVIEANHFPVEGCGIITRDNRKIGLGIMGFADALLELGIPYGSPESMAAGEGWMSFLDREAKSASHALALERGPFKNWKGSLWNRLGYPVLRNATVSTVAPTGTISIVAGASSGIEPIFAGVFARNVLGGKRLREVHPAVERVLKARSQAGAASDGDLSRLLGAAWKPARAVSVDEHVGVQAVFQRHSDSAVSKTVNLPFEATVEDVERVYQRAFLGGCKGITVFRDRSRGQQVLEALADGLDPSCESCIF